MLANADYRLTLWYCYLMATGRQVPGAGEVNVRYEVRMELVAFERTNTLLYDMEKIAELNMKLDEYKFADISVGGWQEDDRWTSTLELHTHGPASEFTPEIVQRRAALCLNDWFRENGIPEVEFSYAELSTNPVPGESNGESFTQEAAGFLDRVRQFQNVQPRDFNNS